MVGPEGDRSTVPYDRLLLTAGSVNKLLPVPGVAQHGHGFRSIAEALYLRDHLLRQLELAATRRPRADGKPAAPSWWSAPVTPAPRSPRTASCSPAPSPAGTPACAVSGSAGCCSTRPRTCCPSWTARLSAAAHRTLTRRGVEIRTGTSVTEATSGGVRLSDGEFVPTRSLIWCVGVRPDPLVAQIGLPTTHGRLNVDEYLTVPGHPETVRACGDIAAVPDLTRPGQLTRMTAQHASGRADSPRATSPPHWATATRRAYRHHDLGFVVDLGGAAATANPLGVPLSGLPAKAVTRGYHLLPLPRNRLRIASEWLLDAALPRQAVQFGLVPAAAVPLGAVDADPRSEHQPAADAPSKQTAGVQRHGLRGTSVPGSAAGDSIAWAPSDAAWPGTCS